ncbi:hypothetical protein [Marivita sp.]|uniref:hypothetical protein n=1 Tax=Marivita sp. TaxID=2003365 RepID=UPI003F6C985D
MRFPKPHALATVLGLALASGAMAQETSDVKFAPGNFGTMVSGKITGQDYIDYRLGANAGQEMFVELSVTDSTGNGTVYFNILPPGSDGVAIYNASMDGNSTTITLPDSGTYAIRVYHMGNDEDSGKTSSFNVDLSIQ